MESPSLITSESLRLAAVPHGFSTRLGGTSEGIFSSLNFGNPGDLANEHRDPPFNINNNLRVLHTLLGTLARELVQVHQVHEDRVLIVRPGLRAHAEGTTRADAIVTDDPARLLAVRTADCVPILMSSGDGRVVAAVHAGWRGVVSGVSLRAIDAMRGLGATSIVGAIGPCIGKDCFEVGEEVAAEFARVFGPASDIILTQPGGKPRIDLQRAIAWQLAGAGLRVVDTLDYCTYARGDLFFSHRRDRGATGRMISVCGPRAG